MESWRAVWQQGFLPSLPVDGLASLADALRNDDERLLQGATTSPPPLQAVSQWDVEGSDPVVWCFWHDQPLLRKIEGKVTPSVAACEEFFARLCFEADKALGEPAACRWFLNWWDETPRDEARRLLLEEVEQFLLLLKVEGEA